MTITPTTLFIPFGTRCNAASIIKDGLGKRQSSYPFDWADMPLSAILEWIKVPDALLEKYVLDYFTGLTLINKRDGAWYPHETIQDNKVILQNIAQKYQRRHQRLRDAFGSGHNIVFLTTMPDIKGRDVVNDINAFDDIKQLLTQTVRGKCFFITINLLTSNHTLNDNHFNYRIHCDDWAEYDKKIVELMQEFITKNTKHDN